MLELNFKNVLLDVININMVFMFLNYIEIDMFLKCFLNSLVLGILNIFEMYMRFFKFVNWWVLFESVFKNDGFDLLLVLIVVMLLKEIIVLKLYMMCFMRIVIVDCLVCFVIKLMMFN